MINILKKEIERKIRRSITKKRDCEFLSDAIFETIDLDISNNTLRRFYGLLPKTRPNKKTLDTLAKFIGFKNYFHFTQTYENSVKNYEFILIYRILQEDDHEELINVINQAKKTSVDFVGLITILVRELLHTENYILLDKLFRLDSLAFNSFSYSEVLILGNAVGLLIRSKSKLDPLLLSNINFLDCVYLIFVDYSSLNKYYGDSLGFIKNNQNREDIALFSRSLIGFRNFLNNKSVDYIDVDANTKRRLHPILTGRLLAVKLLSTIPDINLEDLKLQLLPRKDSTTLVSNFYELYTIVILLKNIEIMSYLITETSSNIEFYFQKAYLNSFYLMCLFYYKMIGDVVNENKFLKLFELNECRDSYKEFIQLIYLVYQFNSFTESQEKKKAKNTYLELSEKFEYPFFSELFLQNYFIESHLD